MQRYADKLSMSRQSLERYLKGQRKPPIDFLIEVASQEDISLDWLLAGEGPRRRKGRPVMSCGPIPILGAVPAGHPGGQRWSEFDAADLLSELIVKDDPDVIALVVDGESMYPTLLPDDKVLMSTNMRFSSGDLVVAETEGATEDYQVKRLGKTTSKEVVLISDNFLQFPPKTFAPKDVQVRGRVFRVVRTPSNSVYGVSDELSEFYRNPMIQETLELLSRLSETAQVAFIESIRTFAKAKL